MKKKELVWGVDIFDCDFRNEHGSKCGVYVGTSQKRCKYHQNKTEPKRKVHDYRARKQSREAPTMAEKMRGGK